MRPFRSFLTALALLSAPLFAYAEDSDVLSLTKDSFRSVVDPEKLMLVEFFAPWCGHCKNLAPEYEQAATILKEQDVKLAKIDCTVEMDLCQEFDVTGYPTLKVFREGSPSEYNGPRKADGIVSYMKKQSLPALSDITLDSIDTFKDSDNVVIIGFFSSNDSEEYKVLREIADELRDDYLFGATVDKDALKKFDVKEPGVILFKKFDDGKEVYDGAITIESLKKFIKSNSVPLLDDIGPENYFTYIESGLPLSYIFYSNEEERNKLKTEISPIAKEHKGKINFVFIDAEKYPTHADSLNLKSEWPAFAIQNPDTNAKYPFDQSKEINNANIGEFVKSFLAGDIQPSIKSEPVPEKNDGDVKLVVATEFEKIVNDQDKDVLVEFYAPWCGHCKNLAPIYEKLGATYSAHKDKIVIAKMDATANDLPIGTDFQIQGFPTIKLFKAGKDKEVVDYEGDRTEASFVEFLSNHAVNKVNVTPSKAEEAPPKEEENPEHDEL
ncbi:protein disulfide isomerase [Basidiobolus meristosporus CBS 931.73]|uniref:Protein disulfide-isomerase n=1 Tax=Basidiobolus meristosporus CBS 931.73 TaxID=1314790 RepID=A0A1Y1X3D3_9FUNG|nr:protein disulfide isomerase [Basidiobolus meristosporus CBS 931.73]|eukprot:ORX80283.1 protein disulfide isomerase [Basidiobolus meristosporus CBS 931.73]